MGGCIPNGQNKGSKGHNIEIHVEMVFARVLCNDGMRLCNEEYLQTLNILNVIALHKHLNIFRFIFKELKEKVEEILQFLYITSMKAS